MKLNGRWFPQIVDRNSENLYHPFLALCRFVLIFEIKCGGGGVHFFVRRTRLSHFMFSSHFMLFPTFLENLVMSKIIVVLASEPVGGRSRATELPCYH